MALINAHCYYCAKQAAVTETLSQSLKMIRKTAWTNQISPRSKRPSPRGKGPRDLGTLYNGVLTAWATYSLVTIHFIVAIVLGENVTLPSRNEARMLTARDRRDTFPCRPINSLPCHPNWLCRTLGVLSKEDFILYIKHVTRISLPFEGCSEMAKDFCAGKTTDANTTGSRTSHWRLGYVSRILQCWCIYTYLLPATFTQMTGTSSMLKAYFFVFINSSLPHCFHITIELWRHFAVLGLTEVLCTGEGSPEFCALSSPAKCTSRNVHRASMLPPVVWKQLSRLV